MQKAKLQSMTSRSPLNLETFTPIHSKEITMTEEKSNEYDNHWLGIINACYSSGLSVSQWCRDNKVANSSFYYQLKRLRNKACELPDHYARKSTVSCHQDVVALQVEDTSDPAEKSHDVILDGEGAESFSSAIRVSMRRGVQLDISNNASAELIANLLLALKSC